MSLVDSILLLRKIGIGRELQAQEILSSYLDNFESDEESEFSIDELLYKRLETYWLDLCDDGGWNELTDEERGQIYALNDLAYMLTFVYENWSSNQATKIESFQKAQLVLSGMCPELNNWFSLYKSIASEWLDYSSLREFNLQIFHSESLSKPEKSKSDYVWKFIATAEALSDGYFDSLEEVENLANQSEWIEGSNFLRELKILENQTIDEWNAASWDEFGFTKLDALLWSSIGYDTFYAITAMKEGFTYNNCALFYTAKMAVTKSNLRRWGKAEDAEQIYDAVDRGFPDIKTYLPYKNSQISYDQVCEALNSLPDEIERSHQLLAVELFSMGFSAQEIPDWLSTNLPSSTIADFFSASISSESAKEWHKQGFTASEAIAWSRLLPSPIDAARWKKANISFDHAQFFIGLGVSEVRLALDWESALPLKEIKKWIDWNFGPQEAAAWRNLGFGPISASEWIAKGFQNASDAEPWILAQFKLDDAAIWATRSIKCEDARKWIAKGISPEIAQRRQNAGIKP